MGGSAKKWVEQATEDVLNVSTAGVYGAATADKGNFLDNMGKSFSGAVTGQLGATALKGTTNIVNDVTGVTAMQQKLDQEAEMSRQEARRRALLSDAMARAEGADNAKITLNTARRAKRAGGSGTGVAGMDTAQGTGVQS